jgi:hypothetical protein
LSLFFSLTAPKKSCIPDLFVNDGGVVPIQTPLSGKREINHAWLFRVIERSLFSGFTPVFIRIFKNNLKVINFFADKSVTV